MESQGLLILRLLAGKNNSRLNNILHNALKCHEYHILNSVDDFLLYVQNNSKSRDLCSMKNRLIIAVELDSGGMNCEYIKLLRLLRSEKINLHNYYAGVIVDGESELYTKSIGCELVFAANLNGCSFPGRSLVEATGSLHNFNIQAQNLNTDEMTAYCIEVGNLINRVCSYTAIDRKNPKLLVLHAAKTNYSNTYSLWEMAKKSLIEKDIEIEEISLRNGTIQDCGACNYETCLHFGEKESCFYGGPMVDEVYPALRKCDGLLLLCPNYNDSVSAHIMAVINRMTALYRRIPFYDKELFSIIVSGYSGSDILAKQLISSLNMNKAFRLPGRFTYMETANNRGEAVRIKGIEEKMINYANRMAEVLKGN